jgi:hypothetical protein
MSLTFSGDSYFEIRQLLSVVAAHGGAADTLDLVSASLPLSLSLGIRTSF